MVSIEVKRTKTLAFLLCFVLLVAILNAVSAEEPGRVDPTFNAFTSDTPQFVPPYGLYLEAIAEQPDGKVVFGGHFRVTAPSYAQSYIARAFTNGDIDLSFLVTVNGPVSEIAVHGDGSMSIAGGFSMVNGQKRKGIARLYEYGGLDAWFDPALVPLYRVENIYSCADGTTVAKAWLTNATGGITKRVVRFNHNGTLDPTFNVTVEPSYYQSSWSTNYSYENLWRLVAATPRGWGNLQGADERFYIVGGFASVNGVSRTNFVRLLPNGAMDGSFQPTIAPQSLAAQPDARLIVWDGTNTVRLNANGTLDPAFNGGRGIFRGGGNLYVEDDGRILVQGTPPKGIPRSSLWRLNSDGTFDWSFHAGTGVTNTGADYIDEYRVVTPLTDRKIMVGGAFNGIDGSWRAIIARLYGAELPSGTPKILQHPNSQALREFQPMRLSSDAISYDALVIGWQKDDQLLPGGTNLSFSIDSLTPANAGDYTVTFSNSAGSITSLVARVSVDPPATGPGSLDLQHAGAITIPYETVVDMAIDFEDRALVSAESTKPVRRLSYDGLFDLSFEMGTMDGVDGAYDVFSVLITPNDDIQIGGYFESIDGTSRYSLARLKQDGELDLNFAPSAGSNQRVSDSVLDPDGKMVFVGSFDTINGVPRRRLARINPDGSLDPTFNSANTFSNRSFMSIHRLPTGKYLLDATNRIHLDGTLDGSFYVGKVAGRIHASAVMPNGDVLIAGSLTNVSNLPKNLIARLRAHDGSLDPSFSSTPLYCPPEGGIFAIALQPDGKIVIGGRFSIATNEAVSNHVARLNSNGTLDSTFIPARIEGSANSWSPASVNKLAIQSDGSIVVGGNFLLINGYPRTNLARLNGDRVLSPAVPSVQTSTATNITFLSATVSGWVNPHDAATRVYFQYGTTTNYGSMTSFSKLPAGTNDVAVTLNVSNVLADTTYHYRIVATNRMGVAFGEEYEFATTSRPAGPEISNPARFGNGGIEFTFAGDTGRSYTVMVSTNLITWSEAGAATEISAGTFKFFSGPGSNPTTFYRLRTP